MSTHAIKESYRKGGRTCRQGQYLHVFSYYRFRSISTQTPIWRGTIRDLVMEVACGLHNLRLRHRPWVAMS